MIEAQLSANRDQLKAQLIEVRKRLSVTEMLTATRIHGMREQPGGPRGLGGLSRGLGGLSFVPAAGDH